MTPAPTRAERRRAKTRALVLAPRRRWSAAAKLEVVMALVGEVATEGEVKAAHGLSDAELAQWLAAYDRLRCGIATRMGDALRARSA